MFVDRSALFFTAAWPLGFCRPNNRVRIRALRPNHEAAADVIQIRFEADSRGCNYGCSLWMRAVADTRTVEGAAILQKGGPLTRWSEVETLCERWASTVRKRIDTLVERH